MNEMLNMYFRIIEDTRCQVNVKHKLVDVLKLVMIANLCGMDELDKIIDYGKNKKDFLDREFDIKSIPSKSTLTRIFCMISPKWLEISILGILGTLIKEKPKQIMLDGKAIKITEAIEKIGKMMNIVTAYTDTGISLGQITVDEKSHGRIEKRTCYVLNEIEFFTNYKMEWKHLSKIFAVKREVEREGKKTKEISCYISSKNAKAEELMSYVRNHWQIESMHHILDVSFHEDGCKLYSKRAQENMNIFRKMSIAIHKNYKKNKKQTMKSSMFNCLLNDTFLLDLLQFCNNR